MIEPVDPLERRVFERIQLSRPATICDGSCEVQRNLVAKALLRLPG